MKLLGHGDVNSSSLGPKERSLVDYVTDSWFPILNTSCGSVKCFIIDLLNLCLRFNRRSGGTIVPLKLTMVKRC